MDPGDKSPMIFVGIDPTASEGKASGVCILDADLRIIFLGKLTTTQIILEMLSQYGAAESLVGFDGPLQPPFELDRCCFSEDSPECNHKQTTSYKGRYCEHLLIGNGFRCYPTSKGSFAKKWILRCLDFSAAMKEQGFKVLEVFPHATRRILFPGITGKKQSAATRMMLQSALREKKIQFPERGRPFSHDELDAALAAYTAYLHDCGKTISAGDSRDGYIILPKTNLKV